MIWRGSLVGYCVKNGGNKSRKLLKSTGLCKMLLNIHAFSRVYKEQSVNINCDNLTSYKAVYKSSRPFAWHRNAVGNILNNGPKVSSSTKCCWCWNNKAAYNNHVMHILRTRKNHRRFVMKRSLLFEKVLLS